jgi:Peptidase family M28
MRNFFFFLFLFFIAFAHAQKNGNPERFAKTITPAELQKRLYIIAGPELEGRETATPGQRKAAAYIESEFKRMGLQPGANGSYQMYYNVYQDSLTHAGLEVGGKAFQLNNDFSLNPQDISATMRFSEALVFGPGAADSMRTANLTGRLVVLLSPDPESQRSFPRQLFQIARERGAAAILAVNNYMARYYGGRTTSQDLHPFKEAVRSQMFYVSEAVARAIVGNDYESIKGNNALTKTYTADVLLDVQKQPGATLQSSNVIGVLPGTDLKDQYLFITGHFDHLGKRGDSVIYYGADDDGSGTVSVLELAEAFAAAKKAGHGPRRTIVFMTVSGEEKGLWGSEYYTSHPIYPLDKTTADLNIDMIGRGDSSRRGDTLNYVYVVGDDKLSSDLKPISQAANAYTKLALDSKFNDPNDKEQIYYRSDHYNFAKNGVPIIFYYDGMLGADYHKPTDTPDKIHYDLLARRAQLVFYTAWDMANRNDMLKRDLALPTLRR